MSEMLNAAHANAIIVGLTTVLNNATGTPRSDYMTALAEVVNEAGGMSAAEILAALLTVDGPASGLNADLLDGQEASAFEPARTTVSQAEAEAGTATTVRAWTAERVKQAVAARVAEIVGAAPSTLDALNELAAAIGNDPNFAATMTAALGGKLNSSLVSSFMLTVLDDTTQAGALATLGAEPARTTVSQAEAEAGTATTVRGWTAERVKQAITAIANPLITAAITALGLKTASTKNLQVGTTAPSNPAVNDLWVDTN